MRVPPPTPGAWPLLVAISSDKETVYSRKGTVLLDRSTAAGDKAVAESAGRRGRRRGPLPKFASAHCARQQPVPHDFRPLASSIVFFGLQWYENSQRTPPSPTARRPSASGAVQDFMNPPKLDRLSTVPDGGPSLARVHSRQKIIAHSFLCRVSVVFGRW